MAVNPKKLRKRLEWLWHNRSHEVDEPTGSLARWRYIPRAYSADGQGWGVYDRLEERFVSDEELVALPMERLQAATHLS